MKSLEEGDDAQRAFDLSIGAHLTSEAWLLGAFYLPFSVIYSPGIKNRLMWMALWYPNTKKAILFYAYLLI